MNNDKNKPSFLANPAFVAALKEANLLHNLRMDALRVKLMQAFGGPGKWVVDEVGEPILDPDELLEAYDRERAVA